MLGLEARFFYHFSGTIIQTMHTHLKRRVLLIALGLTLFLRLQSSDLAQSPTTPPPGSKPDQQDEPVTVFHHSEDSRYWISGQVNIIFQAHPSFPALYSGTNSLSAAGEHATSRVLTLYAGYQITPNTDILFDLEITGGRGISDALGLAGFTNLDVVRNPDLGSTPYIARAMLHQVISLSSNRTESERGPFSLETQLPERRLEFRIGKFSLTDFFDLNSVGSDSHLQFMNWTIDNNGAYDYAADTRGYTYAAMVEYHDRRWAARFAEALMPKVANGINLDLDLSRAHSENGELEFHRDFLPRHPGIIRLLGYINHANMGVYRESIDDFLSGRQPFPDITAHPRDTRAKYGLGVNFEQAVSKNAKIFGRWGWNDGRTESFAYTEVDRTLALGLKLEGAVWGRSHDSGGVAAVWNAISGDHRRYLSLGGQGFLLGDGRLNYRREKILESYYSLHIWRGVFAGPDLQYIRNPGYNYDRGPTLVAGGRLHVDF